MVMVYLEPKYPLQESRCSKWGYSRPRISKCGLMKCHYFSCVPSHSKCVMHAFPHTLGLGHYSFLKWHTENVCLKLKKKIMTSSSLPWVPEGFYVMAKLLPVSCQADSGGGKKVLFACQDCDFPEHSLIAALPWKKKPLPPIVHCDWQRRQIFD